MENTNVKEAAHADRFKDWRQGTENAIINIRKQLDKEEKAMAEYEVDYYRLVHFLFNYEGNLYSILPRGWGSSFDSAETAEGLLAVIHHAMCDDGDLFFLYDPVHGPCISFAEEAKENYMLERSCTAFPRSFDDLEVHWDVLRFIADFPRYKKFSEEREIKVNAFIKEINNKKEVIHE